MLSHMTATTTCTHWTAIPATSDTTRFSDSWDVDTEHDGQTVPAGAWAMFEDFIFVGWTRSESDAAVWATAQAETSEVQGFNGNEGWGQQSEWV